MVLGFRSSYLNVPRVLTNFGIGPLGLEPRQDEFGHFVGGLRRRHPGARERAVDRDVEQRRARAGQARADLERAQRLPGQGETVVFLALGIGLDRRHAPALGAHPFICGKPLVEAENLSRQAAHPLIHGLHAGEDAHGRERQQLGGVPGAGGAGILVAREVMVDGSDAHAGALRDLGHGGGGDPLLGVQLMGGLDDTPAGLLGSFRAAFRSIAPG